MRPPAILPDFTHFDGHNNFNYTLFHPASSIGVMTINFHISRALLAGTNFMPYFNHRYITFIKKAKS